ncbi:putative Dol-P-Glc:Glc(2)Man(9)GlcNAc(2)-PP-Dol alpha-1,2-glucosyltransferase isoform X2 [Anneissia japonica]|uniref:putative Dol-P-Glc:Glc(2)Man(9)GlcNAc(2)-PP-Dol alpha-1,2-glucosyltransferase isoform X2 n=1 Tax=Anneissia japonica TaxID=1529436 RepID=UPI0014255E56|nr:putative Dol-P-Glc:Glc(2)Man(9)GlcNAc(2)-PP-Dol alpha-1,2-glucosyltransferase isoform X2 [Anneissia japonica]
MTFLIREVWDPMITTLPGLYIMSVILLKPISYLTKIDVNDICHIAFLRATNIIFTVGNIWLLYCLQKRINKYEKNVSTSRYVMTSVNLMTFPLLYFFTFLYYTDVASTFFVLLMYLRYLEERHIPSAFYGACAMMFRQTNIIWVVFVAGIVVAREVEKNTKLEMYISHSLVIQSITTAVKSVLIHLYKVPNVMFLLILLSPYLFLMFGFAVFIYMNNGIVVGDRSSHQAVLNFPQIFYFFSFTLGLGAPFLITPSKVISFIKACLRNVFILGILVAISTVIIVNFTYVHPYLVADNRHYTFYVWMKIYSRHELVRLALIPIYLYGGWSIFDSLDTEPGTYLFKIVFFICIAAATVPQKLMEFRYFIVPYLLTRLHMSTGSYLQLITEFILYQVINFITLFLFAYKPFTWPNSNDIQRFMW